LQAGDVARILQTNWANDNASVQVHAPFCRDLFARMMIDEWRLLSRVAPVLAKELEGASLLELESAGSARSRVYFRLW
jgi:hypothetical protein